MGTKIEWTEETWNPVTGCTKVSPGCANCYAERMARRLADRCGYPADEPFRVALHPDRLDQPMRWKKPRRVFVCSMSDLFHDDVPIEYISQIMRTIKATSQHTYQILTKRSRRMSELLGFWWGAEFSRLENVWLGVTAEDQQRADERIPLLFRTPAAVRFVSVEPMLGPVDLMHFHTLWDRPGARVRTWTQSLGWVIVGCESGPGRRPMDLEWARNLVGQCREAGVPVFVKQLSIDGKVSHDPAEWPEDLRVREYPCNH